MRTAFRSTLALSAIAAALGFAVPASAQEAVKNFKFQSTWPASLTLQDNFKMFAERVDKLTSGQVKIEALAAGQIVPAFEILDATHLRSSTAATASLTTGSASTRRRRCSPRRRPVPSAWITSTSSAG